MATWALLLTPWKYCASVAAAAASDSARAQLDVPWERPGLDEWAAAPEEVADGVARVWRSPGPVAGADTVARAIG